MKHVLIWYLISYFIAKYTGQRILSRFLFNWNQRKNAARSTYRGGVLRSGPDELMFNVSVILAVSAQIIASFFLAMADRLKIETDKPEKGFYVLSVLSTFIFGLTVGFLNSITRQYLEDLYETLPAIMNRKQAYDYVAGIGWCTFQAGGYLLGSIFLLFAIEASGFESKMNSMKQGETHDLSGGR